MSRERATIASILLAAVACGRSTPTSAPLPMPSPPAAPSVAERREALSGTSREVRTELKIATWNLEWLNADVGTGNVKRTVEDYARLRKYADRLDADVVAFQEVDGEDAAKRVFSPERHAFHIASQPIEQLTGFAFKKSLSIAKNPDYAELDVGNVRAGADLTITFGGAQLRLMSVHLKSGCFDQPLTDPSDACKKLKHQLPKLEAWIDARAGEGVPFAVLGDFNRRLFKRPDEPFWKEIDDANPPDADLSSATDGQTAQCWDSAFPQFIDHLVLSKSGAALLKPGSFAQHVYDSTDEAKKDVLSDHCPLSIVLASATGSGTVPVDAGTPSPSQDAGSAGGGAREAALEASRATSTPPARRSTTCQVARPTPRRRSSSTGASDSSTRRLRRTQRVG
jgi:endonuclease/exonuclease/phosphatase family metal-dependent hydrolase